MSGESQTVPPQATVLSIGTEITNGAGLDTNSQWLSTQLLTVGIATRAHLTLSDSLDDIAQAFRVSASAAEFVVITGGLGPTLDDLTREAFARAFARELIIDPVALSDIEDRFSSRNRVMPERNRVQALFPEGSERIPNGRGTAPGIWLEVVQDSHVCYFAALPGVPSEMKPMFLDWVLPRVNSLLPAGNRGCIKRYRIVSFGEGESAVEQKLGDLTTRGREPDVGITAHEATITLRITARGPSPADCDAAAETVRQEIRNRLGDLIFGEEDTTLADVILAQLAERRERLAVLEYPLTGGQLATSLVIAAQQSQAAAFTFAGGTVIGNSNDGNNVDAVTLPSHMVAALISMRQNTSADWAIGVCGAVTGLAGGEALITISGPLGINHFPYQSFGDPAIDRARASKTALNLLRHQLLTLAIDAQASIDGPQRRE